MQAAATASAGSLRSGIVTSTSICSSADALAKNLVVTSSPDFPTKGENVTTTFDFDLDEVVSGGTAYYDAVYNGLPYSSQAPLCDEVAKTNDPCPLAIGHHHQVSSAAADFTGKLQTTITWKTADGRQILCELAAAASAAVLLGFRPFNSSRANACLATANRCAELSLLLAPRHDLLPAGAVVTTKIA